jgi:hypothetical protein
VWAPQLQVFGWVPSHPKKSFFLFNFNTKGKKMAKTKKHLTAEHTAQIISEWDNKTIEEFAENLTWHQTQ